MNKYKAIHEHCQKENEQHERRMRQNKAGLNDIFVELQFLEARHAEKKCRKK